MAIVPTPLPWLITQCDNLSRQHAFPEQVEGHPGENAMTPEQQLQKKQRHYELLCWVPRIAWTAFFMTLIKLLAYVSILSVLLYGSILLLLHDVAMTAECLAKRFISEKKDELSETNIAKKLLLVWYLCGYSSRAGAV